VFRRMLHDRDGMPEHRIQTQGRSRSTRALAREAGPLDSPRFPRQGFKPRLAAPGAQGFTARDGARTERAARCEVSFDQVMY
jgi:hypothetical protein